MNPILGAVRYSVQEKLCKHLRRGRNAGVRVRYLIIINLLNDRSAYQTAEASAKPPRSSCSGRPASCLRE